MKPCPHCGDTTEGFIVKAYARGPVEYHFGPDGQSLEEDWSQVSSESRGIVRCDSCMHIRRDLRLADGREVVEND